MPPSFFQKCSNFFIEIETERCSPVECWQRLHSKVQTIYYEYLTTSPPYVELATQVDHAASGGH